MDASILPRIKQSFSHVPETDTRATKIGPRELLVTLVFSLTRDAEKRTLASMRRSMTKNTDKALGRSNFWERLAAKRLEKYLFGTVRHLTEAFAGQIKVGIDLAQMLGVLAIHFLDSTSTTLPDCAAAEFPGTRKNVAPAAFKWHTCFNLLDGVVGWFRMTEGTSHDRKSFPPLCMLAGALIIFDLGYWDYQLLKDLAAANVFFLSRVKSNAIVLVVEVIDGLPKRATEGRNLFDLDLSTKKKAIVEFMGQLGSGKKSFNVRVIGFWNKSSQTYHWYLTNLLVPAKVIYPLYRLRWQVELLYKSCKASLRLADMPSGNPQIIRNLLLLTVVATLIAQPMARIMVDGLSFTKQGAMSVQRAAMVLVGVADEFRTYVLKGGQAAINALLKKLELFAPELIEPNYKNRETSFNRVANIISN